MISEVFYWVLNMSIISTLSFLVVFLISRIKIIPKNIVCLLFVIPYLRMVIPFGFSSKFSLANLLSNFVKTVKVDDLDFSAMNTVKLAESYFPISYKSNLIENVFIVAGIVWISVALLLLVFFAVSYVHSMLRLNNAKHYRDNIYFLDSAEGVAVYGIIKPKIVLPVSYRDKDLTCILAHEKSHIKRLDNLWRIIALCITVVHWFNPFAWIMLKTFLSQLELSCDEKTVKEIGEENRKKYAYAILEAQESRKIIPSSLGSSKTRKRINNILNFKTATVFSTICSVVLLIIMAVVLLTNAV